MLFGTTYTPESNITETMFSSQNLRSVWFTYYKFRNEYKIALCLEI